MPTDRTRRLLAAATATATTAGLLLAGAGGTATAQPTTTRGVWVDLPDDAIVVGADAGPSRSTLAVLYIVPNAVDAGIRETWLLMRSGGAWGLPRLLSDPTRDSYEHDLDVGSDGAVEVVWGEDVPATSDDHMVVRRVAAGSVGPRREIPADPFNDPRIANGPGRTVVAWDQYDGGDLRVKAAIDAGSGFGAIETVSGTTAVWDGESRVGDVSADTSVQVVMQRDVGGNHHAAWATRNLDDTWTRVEELPESYVATADVLPRVVADAASGDALLLHGHRVAGVLHHKATLFDADPLAIGPPEERLTAAVDLGPTANRSARGAILDGSLLVGVLGTAVADLTVDQGAPAAEVHLPAAPQCADGSWVLDEAVDFVCLQRPGQADTSLRLWSEDGAPLGVVTPAAGTALAVDVPDATVPVLVLTEDTAAPDDPRWLLDVGADGTTPPSPTPTPPSPLPTTATPTATPPVPAPQPPPTSFTQGKAPHVKGRARVGATLRAVPGTWSPSPTRTTYRWFAGGKKIRAATRARLRVAARMRGKRLSVRITLTASGITSRTVTVKVRGRVR